MDSYKVIITPDAMAILTNAVDYIMMEKQNPWAADAVYLDALETAARLQSVAGSLRLCKRKVLSELGYRTILFRKHEYLLLCYIDGHKAIVEAVFHQTEDCENKFIKQLKKK